MYLVIGSDGQEYGPASLDTLRQWAADQRLNPGSTLKDAVSGQTMVAGRVPGLFDEPAPAPPVVGANPYDRPPQPMGSHYVRPAVQNDQFPWRSVVYSVLGVLLFFVLHGIGVIFSGYAVVYAFQSRGAGSKWSVLAISLSILSLAAVLIGWAMRMQGGNV